MKNFTNTYIFVFASVMVIVVAAILSLVASLLKPIQNKNEELEKMKSILASVHIESTAKNAEELFQKYIPESYVINPEGDKISNLNAFDVDMTKQQNKIQEIKQLESSLGEKVESPFKKFMSKFIEFKGIDTKKVIAKKSEEEKERQLPVYICNKENETYYIFPLRGKGLWGPIWGYVALKPDMNTIYGVTFDHKTETPGLGAEISTLGFQQQFTNKKLLKDGKFVSIDVAKGGASPEDINAVDAISGGTITSKGLQKMLFNCLSSYQKYFELKRN